MEHQVWRHMSSGPRGPEMLGGLLGCVLILVVAVIALAMAVLFVVAWWKIFSKAGYPGALGLLMLIPLGEPIMVLILGFGRWPVLRELEHLKASHTKPLP